MTKINLDGEIKNSTKHFAKMAHYRSLAIFEIKRQMFLQEERYFESAQGKL